MDDPEGLSQERETWHPCTQATISNFSMILRTPRSALLYTRTPGRNEAERDTLSGQTESPRNTHRARGHTRQTGAHDRGACGVVPQPQHAPSRARFAQCE